MPELRIVGGSRDLAWIVTREACAAMPASAQIADVGTLVPGRRGQGVRLRALLDEAGVGSAAAGGEDRHLHVASSDPAFAVSLPLSEAEEAVVVYALDGAPLPEGKGGPFRLLVPGHPDECVHVKQVAGLEVSNRPGRDTRPKDDAEHEKLHRKGSRP
jgi:2-dehydropantoate 2-reductase